MLCINIVHAPLTLSAQVKVTDSEGLTMKLHDFDHLHAAQEASRQGTGETVCVVVERVFEWNRAADGRRSDFCQTQNSTRGVETQRLQEEEVGSLLGRTRQVLSVIVSGKIIQTTCS
jgi:hypothetical protein